MPHSPSAHRRKTLLATYIDEKTFDGINDALGAGQCPTFRFKLNRQRFSRLPGATNSFQFAQTAIHDPDTRTSSPACGRSGTYNFVPEPSPYALITSGILSIFGFARRRRNVNA